MAFFSKLKHSSENVLDIASTSLDNLLWQIQKDQALASLQDAKAYDKFLARAEKYSSKKGIDAIDDCIEKRNKLINLVDKLI